jgi:hypothetical protein
MMSQKNQNEKYFRLFPQSDAIQLTVKLVGEEPTSRLLALLEEQGAVEMKELATDSNDIVLQITEASQRVLRQIRTQSEENAALGHEFVLRKLNYNVYVYAKKAMMVFSRQSKQWQLGIDFSESSKKEYLTLKHIMNRSISMALSEFYQMTSFWGVFQGKNLLLNRPLEMNADTFHVDFKSEQCIFNSQTLSFNQIKKVAKYSSQVEKRRVLTQEEAFASLLNSSSVLHYKGWTNQMRNNLLSLMKLFTIEEVSEEGLKSSKEL